MTSFYRIKSLRDEELLDAVSLMEKEYDKELRNTPTKMAKLISENFDVPCAPERIAKYLKIENYDNMQRLR